MSTRVPDRKSRHVTGRVPVMSETNYDMAASAQVAAFLALGGTLVVLVIIWLSTLVQNDPIVPIQTSQGEGGWEDGSPDDTLDVESPEETTDDPSLSNDQDVSQLEQITEQIATLSESAAALQQPNEFTDPSGGGNPGSAEGTGGRPLGSGGPGPGGDKRENRWVVRFADQRDLQAYAEQLDFFAIELGCVFRDGRVFYVRKMSTSAVVREEQISSDEQRLFLTWQNGDREKADAELLKKAGVPDPESGTIVHFYPVETEEMLARLEREYGDQPPDRIRRTTFVVKKSGGGYEFVVTAQRLK